MFTISPLLSAISLDIEVIPFRVLVIHYPAEWVNVEKIFQWRFIAPEATESKEVTKGRRFHWGAKPDAVCSDVNIMAVVMEMREK
ncbi:MAG: hypothetical protein ABI977_01355 [Acidobacteriota bacterium]